MFKRRSEQHRQAFFAGTQANLAAVLTLAALGALASQTWAQTSAAVPTVAASSAKMSDASSPAKANIVPRIAFKPGWQDLTPLQQTSLKPLAEKWNTLGETQKRKWIAIAANYPKLAPEEQTKLHSRMTEWVSLSQQQRAQARLNFAESKKLTPSQKTATWNAYQALSPEEKQKLANLAPAKPVGAAAVAKPVPSHKLTNVPLKRPSNKQAPKTATAGQTLNQNALLPPAKTEPDASAAH